jgi:hypothetical protein
VPFPVAADQELEGVERLRRHRLRRFTGHQQRVLLLEDVRARRLRDDHVRARLHEGQERVDIAARVGPRAFDVPAVEVRHPAAELPFRAGHGAAVLLEDGDRVAPDLRLVVVDDAGREERDLVPLRHAAAPALAEPAVERLVMELRQHAVPLDPERLLEERPPRRGGVGPVREGGRGRRQRAQRVRAAQPPVLPAHAFRRRPRRLGPQHQPREVHVEAVRRRVGAVVEAQLALPAEVDDPPVVGARHLRDVPLVRVDPVEHEIEARAQPMAATASVADLGDARKLLRDGGEVQEGGIGRVEDQA